MNKRGHNSDHDRQTLNDGKQSIPPQQGRATKFRFNRLVPFGASIRVLILQRFVRFLLHESTLSLDHVFSFGSTSLSRLTIAAAPNGSVLASSEFHVFPFPTPSAAGRAASGHWDHAFHQSCGDDQNHNQRSQSAASREAKCHGRVDKYDVQKHKPNGFLEQDGLVCLNGTKTPK